MSCNMLFEDEALCREFAAGASEREVRSNLWDALMRMGELARKGIPSPGADMAVRVLTENLAFRHPDFLSVYAATDIGDLLDAEKVRRFVLGADESDINDALWDALGVLGARLVRGLPSDRALQAVRNLSAAIVEVPF